MKLPRFILLPAFLLLSFAAFAEESAKIAKEVIRVPAPEGLVRLDGLDSSIDAMLAQNVSTKNRQLMAFAAAKEINQATAKVPTHLSRFTLLQTSRLGETKTVTADVFKLVSDGVAKKSAADGEPIESKLKKTLRPGESESLGVYERTPRSLDTGKLMTTKSRDNSFQTVVAASSLVQARGKFLFLYVYANAKEPDAFEWTKTTIKSWREAIVTANPP